MARIGSTFTANQQFDPFTFATSEQRFWIPRQSAGQNKWLRSALAGGHIATALVDTLVAKGVLTAKDARNVLLKARRTIRAGTLSVRGER